MGETLEALGGPIHDDPFDDDPWIYRDRPSVQQEEPMGKNLTVDFQKDFSEPDWENLFKIHATDTIKGFLNDEGYDHCNNVFHEGTLEEVIAICQGYLGKPNQTCSAFVIFKPVAIVELPPKPTQVRMFGEATFLDNGED